MQNNVSVLNATELHPYKQLQNARDRVADLERKSSLKIDVELGDV